MLKTILGLLFIIIGVALLWAIIMSIYDRIKECVVFENDEQKQVYNKIREYIENVDAVRIKSHTDMYGTTFTVHKYIFIYDDTFSYSYNVGYYYNSDKYYTILDLPQKACKLLNELVYEKHKKFLDEYMAEADIKHQKEVKEIYDLIIKGVKNG